ncbi:MAG TPA: hypothetical protein VFE10_12490 [Phenylobacterium sp.]|jgi:hypothetical protein|nr:hypothetical protein [Phenylobacterium sp.]
MNRWTRRGAVLAGSAAVYVLCGAQAPVLTYNPNHFQNDDPVWTLLNETQVIADPKKGEYRATFSPALLARQAKRLKVVGFILPLEATSQSAHFSLVRRNTGCPFCPPNAPTEAVEVFAKTPVRYTGEELAMEGDLKLVAASDQGLFFRLQNAEVVPAR